MNDDAQSLRRYAENGSEEAFRELVDRHLPLVYSAALRVLGGDVHLAEDVAQRVFADVARKARMLSHHAVLAGWLHRHTTFTASKAVRSERRRQAREQEAVRMNAMAEPDPTTDPWQQLEPMLDEALDGLGRSDRDAVVLRFLQRQDLRSVGQALGCSEDTAQKRVTRAIEKLRRFLERRGVTLSAAALSTLLGSHAAGAAPAGLAAVISSGAITSVAAGAGLAGAGLTSTLFSLMTTEKLTTVAVSTLLVAGLGTPLALQHRANRNLESEIATLRQQNDQFEQLRAEEDRFAGVQIDPDEADRLRRENAELHRLRGEVALLRNQQQEVERMAAENAEARLELERMALEMKQAWEAQNSRNPEQEQEINTGIQRLNLSKAWMLAIYLYAQEHEGRVPPEMADALPFLSRDPEIEGLPAEDLEIVYAGRLDEIQDPARTLVLREREPRLSLEGKWTRAYGFADGHSEIRSQPTEDFTAWEQERMVDVVSR
jgi:RNA polymerase sigma factor (sigma-70 family)